MAKTLKDVVAIARSVVDSRVRGEKYCTYNGITFNLRKGGMCSRFCRQVHEAAANVGNYGLAGYFGGYAVTTEKMCLEQVRKGNAVKYDALSEAPPGSMIFFYMPRQGVKPGHVAIWLGNNTIAENTSSGSRGTPRAPGTKITHLNDNLLKRITSIVSIFECSENSPALFVDNTRVNCKLIDNELWAPVRDVVGQHGVITVAWPKVYVTYK